MLSLAGKVLKVGIEATLALVLMLGHFVTNVKVSIYPSISYNLCKLAPQNDARSWRKILEDEN